MQKLLFAVHSLSPFIPSQTKIILAFTLLFCSVKKSAPQAPNSTTAYPRIAGYISVVHPIVAVNKHEATYNFSHGYTVDFPCGVNVLTSNGTGFSFEITPFIKTANSSSKSGNFLFHPGVMFRYSKGFTLITRMAFETEGRYGATVVFNKVVARSKTHNYFIAVPVPLRFGAGKPASIGIAFKLGLTF